MKNFSFKKIIAIAISIISLLSLTSCSSPSASKEEQKNNFITWQKDFNSYSTALSDYTKKLDKIIKMLDDGTLEPNQAIANLNDLENKLNSFNLMLHDTWEPPKNLKKEHEKALLQSIYAFENCLVSYKDATKELQALIAKKALLNSPELSSSLTFAKNSYSKAFSLQKQVESDLK